MLNINNLNLDQFTTASLSEEFETLEQDQSLQIDYDDLSVSGYPVNSDISLLKETRDYFYHSTKFGLLDLDKDYLVKEGIDTNKSFEELLSSPTSDVRLHGRGTGGTQELAVILFNGLKEIQVGKDPNFILSTPSVFFYSLAKVSAFKYLWKRLLEENGFHPLEYKPHITLISSIAEQSLLEIEMNILRNNTAALVGIAQGVQEIFTLPYTFITNITGEKKKRAQRIARNSVLMAQKEAKLNICHNALEGAFHLENLTQEMVQKTWNYLVHASKDEKYFESESFQNEITQTQKKRLDKLQNQTKVMVGVNKFQLEKVSLAELHPSFSQFSIKRYSEIFENKEREA